MATVPYTAARPLRCARQQGRQAALLAKTDLLTDMVGEFPELQGIMGGYYARHDGLRDGVAIAIEDHYKPRFAGDALPRNHTGTVVALADKLETLCRPVRHRPAAHRRQGPVRAAPPCAGRDPHAGRKNLPLALPALVDAGFAAFPCRPRPRPGRPAAVPGRPPGRAAARAGLQRAGGRRRGGAAARRWGEHPASGWRRCVPSPRCPRPRRWPRPTSAWATS
jgi:hypothetical protein